MKTSRRGFFNSLSAAVVGVYLGCHVKLENVIQKVASEQTYQINPEWIEAEYELCFAYIPDEKRKRSVIPILYKRSGKKPDNALDEPYPIRADENGKYISSMI